MPNENPGAYDEARKRIRENQEQEYATVEKKKENFEKGKEMLFSRKRLDIFELKRRIDTGHSLLTLKSDISEALRSGQISIDTYTSTLELLDAQAGDGVFQRPIVEYTFDKDIVPLGQTKLAQYFESKRIGENVFVDIGGIFYGIAQSSTFLVYLLGRLVLDALLLPRDIYTLMKK